MSGNARLRLRFATALTHAGARAKVQRREPRHRREPRATPPLRNRHRTLPEGKPPLSSMDNRAVIYAQTRSTAADGMDAPRHFAQDLVQQDPYASAFTVKSNRNNAPHFLREFPFYETSLESGIDKHSINFKDPASQAVIPNKTMAVFNNEKKLLSKVRQIRAAARQLDVEAARIETAEDIRAFEDSKSELERVRVERITQLDDKMDATLYAQHLAHDSLLGTLENMYRDMLTGVRLHRPPSPDPIPGPILDPPVPPGILCVSIELSHGNCQLTVPAGLTHAYVQFRVGKLKVCLCSAQSDVSVVSLDDHDRSAGALQGCLLHSPARIHAAVPTPRPGQ